MKRKTIQLLMVWIVALVLSVPGSVPVLAAPGDMAALVRLYEGFRGDVSNPEEVISSYYLKPFTEKKVTSGVDIKQERETLKRVFSLTGVKMITEATMVIREGNSKTPFQVFVMNGRKMLLQMSPLDKQKNKFKVEVFKDEQSPKSLFGGTIFLPQAKSTALGFEDSAGRIYFLSFHRREDFPASSSKVAKKASHTKKPKLLKKADPIYPDVAKKSKVQGKVMVEATTNLEGEVVKAVAIKGPELLKQAAVDAVKKWKYAPFVVNGVKEPVSFTVLINFRLQDDGKERPPLDISSIERPKLIKKVAPKYPREALKKRISGKVVLEAVVDTRGIVEKVNLVDGIKELNQAAIDALKQWKYKPFIKDGVKRRVRFTVIVKFHLHRDKKKENKPKENKQK